MGCFSFMCKESGKAVAADDACRIYLLKDGNVIEEMRGHYDNYGRVENASFDSFEWNTPWDEVCNLCFDDNEGNGLAIILEKHFKGNIPTTLSERDSNQGWGKNQGGNVQIKEPIHIVL